MPDFTLKQNFPIQSVVDAAQRKAALEQQSREHGDEQLQKGLQAIGQIGQSLVDKKLKVARALSLGNAFGMDPAQAKLMEPDDILKVKAAEKGFVDAEFLKTALASMSGGKPPAAAETTPKTAKPAAATPATVTPSPVPAPGSPSPLPGPTTGSMPVPIPAPPLKPQMVNKATADIAMKAAMANREVPFITTEAARGMTSGPKDARIIQQERQPMGLSQDRASFNIIKDYNANPQVRRQQQSIDGASAVRELATSGNPIAAAAIPTYMARASGEVGNLSEPDKAPFGGTRAILGKLEASLKELSTGQLTEDNKRFLMDLSDTMERNAETNLDRKGREIAKQYSKTVDIPAEEIYKSLRPGRPFEEPKPDSKDVLTVGGTFHGKTIIGVREVKK